jgi:hypothetical protein
VDGELSPDESRELLDHARGCRECREALALLRRERGLLTLAHKSRVGSAPRKRSVVRTAGLAAAILILLGAGLARLHEFYSETGARLAAERDARKTEEILGRKLAVAAEGVPLGEFLEMLERESGVPVRLDEGARQRPEPSIHLSIVTPVRLGSLVHLLEDFYGLRATVRDGTVRLG